MAFAAGLILPIQAGMNSRLAKAAGSPLHASMISFIVGVVSLVLYILVVFQPVSWKGVRDAPLYAWGGGLLGAFYVTVIVFAFPRIGPGLTFGLVVAGQLLVSMLMEHYQFMGAQFQPISPGRIIGMLLIVVGVVMMKKF